MVLHPRQFQVGTSGTPPVVIDVVDLSSWWYWEAIQIHPQLFVEVFLVPGCWHIDGPVPASQVLKAHGLGLPASTGSPRQALEPFSRNCSMWSKKQTAQLQRVPPTATNPEFNMTLDSCPISRAVIGLMTLDIANAPGLEHIRVASPNFPALQGTTRQEV